MRVDKLVDVCSIGRSMFTVVDDLFFYRFGQFDLVPFDGQVVSVEVESVRLLAG